jgi:polar amino acid transport system permease protein
MSDIQIVKNVALEDRLVEHRVASRRGKILSFIKWAIPIALLMQIFVSFVISDAMRWEIIAKYFLSGPVLLGVVITLAITFGAAVIGMVGGLAIAVARMSTNNVLKGMAIFYLSFFRSVPLLVQILIWYNLASFFPTLWFGIPYSPWGIDLRTNDVLTPMTACLMAFGLNLAAYTGEIIRGGITGVAPGQVEAAMAIGMTDVGIFRRVVAPQAFRLILPSLGNELISLLKSTALVSVIGVGDLMTKCQDIYAVNYQIIPLLMVASIWYLILTVLISVVQTILEARFSRSIGKISSKGLLLSRIKTYFI